MSTVSPGSLPTGGRRKQELTVFLVLTLLLAPALAITTVGGYGLAVWVYQMIAGPPGPPAKAQRVPQVSFPSRQPSEAPDVDVTSRFHPWSVESCRSGAELRFGRQVEIVSLIVSTWPQHLDAVSASHSGARQRRDSRSRSEGQADRGARGGEPGCDWRQDATRFPACRMFSPPPWSSRPATMPKSLEGPMT